MNNATLQSLLAAWTDDTLSPEQRRALEELVANDPAARAAWQEASRALEASFAAETPRPAPARISLLAAAAGTSRFGDLTPLVAEMLDIPAVLAATYLRGIDEPASWEPGPVPAIELFHLDGGPEVAGAITGFVRVAAGEAFPHHEHLGDEYILVVQGALRDSDGTITRAGEITAMEGGTDHEVHAHGPLDCIYLAVVFEGVRVGDVVFGPDSPEM